MKSGGTPTSTLRRNTLLHALLLTPVVIGSCAAIVLLGLRRRFGEHRLPAPRRNAASDDRSLAALRDAIVGNGKSAIASVFGPPRSTARNTWYYPLRPRERLAMAISFDGGLAREVEFIPTPQ
jgi:hypothetical protein